MVRSYSRHGPVESFGVISSNSANAVFDGKVAWVPGLEDVLKWNMKKGELLDMWHETGLRTEVTCIARSPIKDTFAVGYQDGSIRLWSDFEKSVTVTFNGHRKAVTALAFDRDGSRLASGSQDTDIIMWDVMAENGMFRLRGHRDQITSLAFISAPPAEIQPEDPSTSGPSVSNEPQQNHLISSSKDTLLKLWDMSTQHCVSTVVAHRTQVWSLCTFVDPSTAQVVVITAGGEGEARAWKVDAGVLAGEREVSGADSTTVTPPRAITALVDGLLPLASLSHAQRIAQVAFHPSEQLLAFQTTDKTVEILRLRTSEEIRKKAARRAKREREKKKGKTANGEGDVEAEVSREPTWKDRLASWITIRASGKIRSFDFGIGANKLKVETTIMCSLASNAVEIYQLPPQPVKSKKGADEEPQETEATRTHALELPGHRTDIRTLALSSDDALLASGANGQLKIWNVKTTKCLRTMDCGYAICSAFLPGDRHIVVGTKSGEIMLYDVGSSTLLETFQAHASTVWGISVRPDGKGLVSGSADKDIKFWEFEIKDVVVNAEEGDDAPKATRRALTMVHTKTLKMTDDVLAVKYSPDGRLLAVSLLDSTVKVFYADSLKFYLSLYGHKLPVLAMDISSDSKLITTCSADKNVKIWGLDFGDCHRSLFAHDDSIMQVQFEQGTHYFWTVGKDKLVKYWDGDKFECIQKLEGHHAEVWALAVSHEGKFVATAAHDKSIRIWEKLDEPLFLEEERERELEAIYDANVERDRERDELRVTREGGAAGPEATAVEKTTTETLMAGERIMEALDVSEEDRLQADEFEASKKKMSEDAIARMAPRKRNAIFSIYGTDTEPEVHVLKVVQKIPPASLNDALLVLPFSKVVSMLKHLDFWASRKLSIPLTSRILFFLVKTHYSQIIATRLMRTTMLGIREHLSTALSDQKETIGYNMAALRYVQRQNTSNKVNEFYEREGFGAEEKVKARIEEGIKKRKRASIKA